ncbi:hypothetical protein V6N12_058826 [Hibiscus sabdariffa]|uniref:Uncharacterized protein n=1 Tax=Hibiscus sabdariffa TaxID=183260 RepID=A0ABR2ETC6_9ROSI
METTYLEEESYRVSWCWSWIQFVTGKPMVEVERIAVQVITEAHAASLQPRSLSLRPLRLHLPNKLFQPHKFDTIPMVCHFLFQLLSLQDLQNSPNACNVKATMRYVHI